MRSFAAVSFLLAIAGLASAQSINPDSVDIATRRQWCQSQKSSCPLLCLQYPGNSASTSANDCDPKTLVFNCVCAVNGLSPNASEYSQTIPYFTCTEWGNQCVTACGQNSACASSCRADNPCGAQSPTLVNTSTITSTIATATDGSEASATSAVFTGFGNTAETTAASADDEGAAAMVNLGQSYGLAVVVAGVLAGFALVL